MSLNHFPQTRESLRKELPPDTLAKLEEVEALSDEERRLPAAGEAMEDDC